MTPTPPIHNKVCKEHGEALKPYYESERVKLYCGDCLEILPTMADGSVECVVTDPPWRASTGRRIHVREGQQTGAAPSRESRGISYGDIGLFNADVIRDCCRVAAYDVAVLCGYIELAEVLAAVQPTRGVFAWHNTRPTPIAGTIAARDAAFVVWGGKTSIAGKNGERWQTCVFRWGAPQGGCMATERVLNSDGSSAHPAQEPLGLFIDIVRPLGQTILDPYAGSGTTGVAAIQLGRAFIGIEREEKYCAIAARRIQEAEQAFALFEQPQLEVQGDIFGGGK